MYVTHYGELYEADLSHGLLENLKKTSPMFQVKITQSGKSSYAQVKVVPISELEDYSVQRNINALS
jgi:hypothetical protein